MFADDAPEWLRAAERAEKQAALERDLAALRAEGRRMRGALRRRVAEAAWPLLYAAARKCERLSRDAAYAGRLDAANRWWRVADGFGRKARAAERLAKQG